MMVDLEEEALRRLSGPRIIRWSLILGLCGIGPILLYALLGPADGNPIGLGLLAIVTVPVVATGIAVGVIKTIVELLLGRAR